jgi:hypothetical protein
MIASYPAGELQAVPVGRQINKVRNQGAELIEPAGAPLARLGLAPRGMAKVRMMFCQNAIHVRCAVSLRKYGNEQAGDQS